MPNDRKERIAAAAKRLLLERHVKKLTVTDLVEECQITRQTFYYHFDDIPDLFRWVMEQESDKLIQELQDQPTGEESLRTFFLLAIQVLPQVRQGMRTNYGPEMERLLEQYLSRVFTRMAEQKGLFQHHTPQERAFILRYHIQAILGLLQNWTEADTQHLDQIVSLVYQLLSGEVTPFA